MKEFGPNSFITDSNGTSCDVEYSMGLLLPIALALLALAIPIIIFYMLKLRRRDQSVSSSLLWRRALLDRTANAPWQRLRRDRKSTRLNSSHGYISYAVFCLKKKKTNVEKAN